MQILFWTIVSWMTLAAVATLVIPLTSGKRTEDGQSRLPFFAAAFFVPVFAIALYANLGSPQVAVAGSSGTTAEASDRRGSTQVAPAKNIASVGDLVDGLAARLAEQPDDAGGWLLLAKSYRHLDRRADALAAYEKASALGKTDAELEAWFEGPSQDGDPAVVIRGRVSISPDYAPALDGTATIFIVAKSAGGSPVPLAVARTTVARLPYEFAMTDANAMVAGNDLSSAETIIVSASASLDGDAMNTVPGLTVQSTSIDTRNPAFVNLTLGE